MFCYCLCRIVLEFAGCVIFARGFAGRKHKFEKIDSQVQRRLICGKHQKIKANALYRFSSMAERRREFYPEENKTCPSNLMPYGSKILPLARRGWQGISLAQLSEDGQPNGAA